MSNQMGQANPTEINTMSEQANILERRISIVFNWWRSDNKGISDEHNETLIEDAEERIHSMMKDGYVQGQLNTTIHTDEEDIEFRGHWEAETTA